MVSECGPGCKTERDNLPTGGGAGPERDDVRQWTRMQTEADNVLSGGGEGAWWCQTVDADANGTGQRTSWRWRVSVWRQTVDAGAKG